MDEVESGGMFEARNLYNENEETGEQPAIKLGMHVRRNNTNSDVKLGMSLSGVNRSQLRSTRLKKSSSGFDIGVSKAVGSFFSVERQKSMTGKEPNFLSAHNIDGKIFVDKLIDQ